MGNIFRKKKDIVEVSIDMFSAGIGNREIFDITLSQTSDLMYKVQVITEDHQGRHLVDNVFKSKSTADQVYHKLLTIQETRRESRL